MKKVRSFVFLLMICFGYIHCAAQIVIDHSVEKRYNKEFRKIPLEFRTALKKKENDTGLTEMQKKFFELLSYGFFTLYQTDTLNKEDLVPHPTITVSTDKYFDYTNLKTGKRERTRRSEKNELDYFFVDPQTGKASPAARQKKYKYSDGVNTYIPAFSKAILQHDSLIFAFPGLFEPLIEHVLTPASIQAFYKDYNKNDTVFSTEPYKSKTNSVSLQMNITNFVLSGNRFIEGNVIYGEAEMITPEFRVDNASFKNGYITKQLHFKYLFQLKPVLEPLY